MQIYLVGGAVRDQLLDLPVTERDWVVVGATPEDMTDLGYRPVGKDFPVFLHPDSKEEYALARTERKSGRGYKGFQVHASPEVSLKEDLQRRDLTINAMAQTADGGIIDPYGGQQDLAAGLLHHVSPAFVEDPVRILRVARFAARLSRWGFRVAHDTNALMRHMVDEGEVDYLVPERVWAELVKALGADRPAQFFKVLHGCGALAKLFPELEALYGSAAAAHGDDGAAQRVFDALNQAAEPVSGAELRFALLARELARTQGSTATQAAMEAICARYKAPNEYRELALLVARTGDAMDDALRAGASAVAQLLDASDALRRPQRFQQAALVCQASHGTPYPQRDYLLACQQAAAGVSADALLQQGLKGPAIGARLKELRSEAIAGVAKP